jgi:lactate permease
MLPLFSLAPFFLFIGLLFWKRASLFLVSTITLVFTIILTVFYWQIVPYYLAASAVKGLFIALDIFIIIFGAVLFLEILKSTRIIDSLCGYLSNFSPDYRIQVILLAWFLENFIEGTAGFGTPSAVAGPLLVGLGLTPINAAIVALLGNSTSVAFGAAGTPIRIGFAGLEVSGVPLYTALFGLVGAIVPVFMLWMVTKDKINKKQQFLEALPFAVWSGIAFVVPALATVLIGQEFPSILGAVAGILIIYLTIKLKLFIPGVVRRHRDETIEKPTRSLGNVVFPYLILIGLLVAGKFLLGTRGIAVFFTAQHTFAFFNPGFAFLIAALFTIIFIAKDFKIVGPTIKVAFKRTLEPFLVIIAMSSLVQLMIYSGHNVSGFPSSLDYLASGLENAFLPVIAPLTGAFGSFLTGSATVSNIMFGDILAKASGVVGYASAAILALQVSGAAAGNMIAIADILTAEAVIGLKGKTRAIIRGVFVPCLIYVLLICLVGIIFV